MKTVVEILSLASSHLQAKGFERARKAAEEIISDALGLSRMQLYLEHDRPLTEAELQRCREYLARRSKGEPAAYIHGEVEFHDCLLTVTPDVLIPRQETGILVDLIRQELKNETLEGKTLVDVCTGSGCIGLALKRAFPALRVILSDVSEKALALAERNAKANHLEVVFLQADLLNGLEGEKVDFLVSNPPYVSDEEYAALDREVRQFEPKLALVADDNGLEFYKRFAISLSKALLSGGKAWFEIGASQGDAVKEIFAKEGVLGVVKPDWSGKDRFFVVEIPTSN